MKRWGTEIITFIIKLAITLLVVFSFVTADDSVKWVLVYLVMMIWDRVSNKKLDDEINLLKERIDQLECELENSNTRMLDLKEKANE